MPDAVTEPKLARSVITILAGPPAAAIAVVTAFAVAEWRGYTPVSYQPPSNFAEAAGMGIGSEAMRFLREGADPNEVANVRPDIISSEITRVTGLEAAIWSRRVELVRMLDREGAIQGAAVRHHLACLATHLRVQDVLVYLAPTGLSNCNPDETFRAIRARSQ
jgi:hypothetical protein